MTVIVAARTADGIVMASDSEITGGWQRSLHATPKVWVDDQAVWGAAGSIRAAQVARHLTEWPLIWPGEDWDAIDVERFLVTSVWPALRESASFHGTLRSHKGEESIDAEFLVAWGGYLVEIDSGGAVVLPPSGRAAIGSGYAEALGHLGQTGPWTREDVIEAVRKAKISAVGVGGPVYVADTNGLTVDLVVA